MKTKIFNNSSSLVLFHGTDKKFCAFDKTSHLRGNPHDHNNQLGVWLTNDVGVAMDYAEAAGAPKDFHGTLVVEVDIPDSEIASYSCNLNAFVMGEFNGVACQSSVEKVFDRARRMEQSDLNRSQAFLVVRDELLINGYKALRLETPQEKMLAVLDPTKISIRARLIESEGILLYRMMRAFKLGSCLRAVDASDIIERIIERRHKQK